jgi:hypothetical protein
VKLVAPGRASRIGGFLLLGFGIVTGTSPISVLGDPTAGPMSLTLLDSEYLIPRDIALVFGPVGVVSIVTGWLATIDRPSRVGIAATLVWFVAGAFALLTGAGGGILATSTLILILLTWDGLRADDDRRPEGVGVGS